MYKKIFLGVLLFLSLSSWNIMARAEPILPTDNYTLMPDIMQSPIGNTGGYTQGNKVLVINRNLTDQKGAIWSKYKIDITKNFTFSGYVYLGNSGTGAGDGATFTFTNDPRMTTNYSSVIGGGGGAIGAYDGVQNAISLEFDTYYNSDRDPGQNNDRGHIAFTRNGGTHKGISYPSVPLSNGTWRKFTISYTASTKTFSYNVGGMIGSATYTNLQTILNGTSMYFGFTSATGAATQENAVAISELSDSKKITSSIKNKTLGENFSQSTRIQRNQIASFNSDFLIGGANYVEGSPKVRLNLPAGKLSYVNNTLFIDGVQVPASKIITEPDGTLTIDVADYVSSGDVGFNLTMDATVTTVGAATDENIQLNYSFIDNKTNIVSNNIFAIIPKAKKVTIKSLDKDTNATIATDQIVLGATGESLNIIPPTINGFVFVNATPSLSMTFTEADQILSMYYYKRELRFTSVPSEMSFGNVKIGNTVRESFATVSNATGVSIRDTRSGGNWSLSVKQSQELIDPLTSKKMQNIFFKNGSTENQLATDSFLPIYNGQSDNITFNKNIFWGTNQGFFTKIRPSDYVGHYQGKVEWLLSDTP